MLNGFISYSHKDVAGCKELRDHLKPVERRGQIQFWSDHHMKAGRAVTSTILDRVEQTDVALLLLSTRFVTSDFIFATELPAILRRWEDGLLHCIPVVLTEFNWEFVDERVKDLLMVPPDARAIQKYSPRTKGFSIAVKAIDDVLKELIAGSAR